MSQVTELGRQFQEARDVVAKRIEIDYRQAINREQMLQAAVATTKDEADRLNLRSFDYKRRRDEAEADRKLFEQLTAKIREAGVNAGFESSTIRIADLARPPAKPIWPNIPLAVSLAFIGSLLFGVAAILIFEMADTSVRDPEQVSRMLGSDVIGVLPSVSSRTFMLPGVNREEIMATARKKKHTYNAMASYEEAVRTIRTTILLSDVDRRVRSVLVTSAFQKEGKSTTALHLAIAHADQKKRTLIIDADLRRPVVHKRLDLKMGLGLGDVLTENLAWQDLVLPVPGNEYLYVLPAGSTLSRPSDLLGGLPALLDEVTREYDFVMIDAPPMLGFAESAQIASMVDAVVVVARAGHTSRKAVSNALSVLRRARANVLGLILNRYESNMSVNAYSYGYYGYGYGENGSSPKVIEVGSERPAA